MGWTRSWSAEQDHGGAVLYRDDGLVPGKRTLTQSLVAVQRRATGLAPSVPPAVGPGRDGSSTPAIDDPFDFREHVLATVNGPRSRASDAGMCSCGTCASCQAGAATDDAADRAAPAVHRRAAGSAGVASVDTAVAQGLASAGRALDGQTRTFMESRFGHDFGDVRVHADGAAGASAQALRAEAYTVGRDIVFASGRYDPDSSGGRHLLAHELTHVVQQGGGRAAPEVAQRQAAASAPDAAAPAAGPADDSTARLQQLITRIEQVHARSALVAGDPTGEPTEPGSPGDATDVHQHRGRVAELLAQLRAVASGGDEAAKQGVLRAFSPAGAQQAERTLESLVRVEQRRPEGMAARSLQVSAPSDPAEVEAERVADAVMASGTVTVQQRAAGPHRQAAEAMIAGGLTVLEVDAVTAPETGPPGWIIGGIVALGALAVIGAGYVLMSASGNVADTGIMEEAQALIAAGAAATICAALQILMDQASDSRRKQRIKATQKAKGCRHSRHS